MKFRRLVCLVIFALVSTLVSAHPHLWIDSTIDLRVEGDGLHAVTVTWLFDEFNSADMIFSFDENRDGEISGPEQERLRLEAFSHLAEMDYFLIVFRGQDPVEVGEADAFRASIEGGRLEYQFTVPVRVLWRDISDLVVASFDSSYFIDFLSDPAQTRYARDGRTIALRNETLQLASEGWGTISVAAVRADLQ